MNIKKTLKIAGIICLVACALSAALIFMQWQTVESNYVFYMAIIEIVLSVFTGVFYLKYSTKTENEIIEKKTTFFVVALLNIFNSLLVWIVAFWVQIMISKLVMQGSMAEFVAAQQNTVMNDDNESAMDSQAKNLEQKLIELKNMREKNLISEEEYAKLKKEAVNKFME